MAEEVKELINEETKAEETTAKTDGKEKGKVQRKKGFRLLIVGLVLVLGSAIFAVYARQTSYQQSKIVGQELSSVKSKISSIEAGKSEGNLESLKKTSESLAEEKLSRNASLPGIGPAHQGSLQRICRRASFPGIRHKTPGPGRLYGSPLLHWLCIL